MDAETSAYAPAEPGIYSMHRYIHVFQWLIYWTGRLVVALFIRRYRKDLKLADLEPDTRYVVGVNHQTYLDPLVVPALIPTRAWGKIGKPHTMVANRFFDYPVVSFIMRSAGCFPARVHPSDPYGLEYAKYHLDHGQSVIIYPEGRISRRRQHRAKNGIMVLSHQPNVKVIPIHLEWRRTGLGLFCLDVCVGKPFDASQMLAEEILEYIYALPIK